MPFFSSLKQNGFRLRIGRKPSPPVARRNLATQLPDLLTPDVIAHLPPFFDLTDQNIDQWIDARDAESDIYLIRETGTDAIIGLMFLRPHLITTFTLGIFLGNRRGGRGMQANYLQDWCCMSPRLVFVCLGVLARKPASAHVLRKTGFQLVPELSDTETEMFGITLN